MKGSVKTIFFTESIESKCLIWCSITYEYFILYNLQKKDIFNITTIQPPRLENLHYFNLFHRPYSSSTNCPINSLIAKDPVQNHGFFSYHASFVPFSLELLFFRTFLKFCLLDIASWLGPGFSFLQYYQISDVYSSHGFILNTSLFTEFAFTRHVWMFLFNNSSSWTWQGLEVFIKN